MGSDRGAGYVVDYNDVSIRAPAWGATRQQLREHDGSFGFNSRSRVGSDDQFLNDITAMLSFNSRSRVGSDGL